VDPLDAAIHDARSLSLQGILPIQTRK